MHFIFGYQREIPVKREGKTSKTALIVLAILIILFLIFLSFENLDEEPLTNMDVPTSPPILDSSSYLVWQGQSWVGGGLMELESSRFMLQL
jgi:hypothetical protein